MDSYVCKKTHCKAMILNYIVTLLKADTDDKYRKILLELSEEIHKL